MKKKDRFDLEDDITKCWAVVDELTFLSEHLCEYDIKDDDVSNILTGMASLFDARFKRLFRTFTEVHELDQFAPGRKHNV